MTHTLIIDIHQIFWGFHFAILTFMIEPSRAYRHIAFGWQPSVSICMTYEKFVSIGIAGIYLCTTQERPVGGAHMSTLIAHPSATRSSIGETNGIGLQLIHHRPSFREVIVVPAVDIAFLFSSSIITIAPIGFGR